MPVPVPGLGSPGPAERRPGGGHSFDVRSDRSSLKGVRGGKRRQWDIRGEREGLNNLIVAS